jgi:microcin C transport system substrate-binding protein
MRVLAALALGALVALSPTASRANEADPPWRHALSLMGTIKYPPGFPRFDYVNPEAPKGGLLRMSTEGNFDSFNFIIPRGTMAPGVQALVYEQLMEGSADEISTEYGHLAEAVRHPADYSWVEYRVRANARWHDGRPVTAEDVLWSFEVQVANNPSLRFYYRDVARAEIVAERTVRFTFSGPGNREKPLIMGQLTVLPRHWWTGTDAQGRQRDITQTTLEPPLGSGPYRVRAFQAGRQITFERVRDWWARDLNIMVGRHNFDEVRFDVYRDDTVEFEAFKADQIDWRSENRALTWSTGYDFPAVRENRVLRETFPVRNRGIMQSFAFNTRRERFADPRVRRAFNYAFDYEEANRALFFGLYKRIGSFFHGTDLASSGVPQGLEREILETVRGRVPDALFTEPFRNPVGGSPEAVRNNLREANRLLTEAGWVIRDRALVNARTGERMRVEFLLNSPAFERIVLPYKTALERLGMEVSVRLVDPSQYITRLRSRDFDVIVASWAQSLNPGNEQREYWGSESADREGSRNLVGIKNPAVDQMIERVVFARDRAELEAATRALDRVLLWNHYVVPQWSLGSTWTARWDRFGRPERLPDYSFGFPDIWWFDPARAARVGGRGG